MPTRLDFTSYNGRNWQVNEKYTMANIDLNILPLHRQEGRAQNRLPGLHVAEAPRGASRSRRSDKLILLLSFNVPAFSEERQDELLSRLEALYFEKSGSTTMAMRGLIEDLNSLIMNLNLKYAGQRPQVTGSIAVVVLRGDLVFLAQNGPGHFFALLPGKVDYLHDEKLTARGLGLNRTPAIYYAQLPLAPDDKLLFSVELPEGWDEDTFRAAYTLPPQKAQQRFLEDGGDALRGMLLDVHAGNGNATLVHPPQEAAHPAPVSHTPVVEAPPQPQPATEEPPVRQAPPEKEKVTAAPPPRRERAAAPVQEEPAPQPTLDADSSPFEKMGEAEPPRSRRRRPSAEAEEAAAKLAPALLNFLKKMQTAGTGALKGLKGLLQRMVPGEELIQIPAGTMAFIAVAVPLLVVTVAALVYAQVGRNQQYQQYFVEAQNKATAAVAEADPQTQRQLWADTITLVDSAEEYLITDEASALRQQASDALDLLDNITRLEFESAISGSLSPSIRIRDMVATSRSVYMLDIDSDSVLRAWLAGSRYDMDPDFRCGAGQYGSIIVQNLVDIALLPDNPEDAVLVAIDEAGNMLYCYEDQSPVAITLTPPDSYWGEIAAITVENDQLYVLDKQLNMLWFYEPSDENYQFRDDPLFFFTEEVPNMTDAIDFAIDQEQLYLLYLNGQTTTCTYTGMEVAPTSCVAPTEYNDPRTGHISGPTIEGAVFYQLQHTNPPEPSLYYLDPVNFSIYHFSLKLNLVQQYKPQATLDGDYISAFTVSPTKTIFVALENRVYLAHLP